MKAREEFLKKLKQGNFSTPEELEAAEGLRMLGGENAIRSKLEKVDRKLARKSPFISSAFSIAATVSLLIIAVSVWWVTNNQFKKQQELAQNTSPTVIRTPDSLIESDEILSTDSVVQFTPDIQVKTTPQKEPLYTYLATPPSHSLNTSPPTSKSSNLGENFEPSRDGIEDNIVIEPEPLAKEKIAENSNRTQVAENAEIKVNSSSTINGNYKSYNSNNSNVPAVATETIQAKNSKAVSSKPSADKNASNKKEEPALSAENSCIEQVMRDKKLLVNGEVKMPTNIQVSLVNGKVNIGFKGMENWTSTELSILQSAVTYCTTLKEGEVKDLILMLPLKIKMK